MNPEIIQLLTDPENQPHQFVGDPAGLTRAMTGDQPEPTDDEVEEAWDVYLATCRAIDTMTTNPHVHESMRATHGMRAALIAFLESRKANQP